MSIRYHAHGKLLISGEYLVLRGARALAVPLKLGQEMEIEALPGREGAVLDWRAMDHSGEWFRTIIGIPGLDIMSTTDRAVSERLIKVITVIREMNSGLLGDHSGYRVVTRATFAYNWGLGSSSALIVNLARWAGIDPFELNAKISPGSGYDVAAALSRGPILFRRNGHAAEIKPVRFAPPFRDRICFAYLGNKQNTAESLEWFNREVITDRQDVIEMGDLTMQLLHAGSPGKFLEVVAAHELVLSRILGRTRIKDERFPDFEGEVKSLGAWGGDFIMAVSPNPAEYTRQYLSARGIHVVFGFDELILH